MIGLAISIQFSLFAPFLSSPTVCCQCICELRRKCDKRSYSYERI